VWALYPESSQRTLEEMDMLFAADSPWVWAAESNFKTLMAENPDIGGVHRRDKVIEAEKGLHVDTEHEETVTRNKTSAY
jgi:hypothetical protein